MSKDFEVVLITTDDGWTGRDGEVAAGLPPAAGKAAPQHSGLILQTARDGWIYCKASKKMVAGNQLLPWLAATAAAISAITGLAIFATLQESAAVWARITVGAVAVLTAVITAVQGWTVSRIKSLNDQAHKFHEFHREVLADLEAGKDLTDGDYAKKRETELQGLVAGISEPSPRAWNAAEERVDTDAARLFPKLFPPSSSAGAATTAH